MTRRLLFGAAFAILAVLFAVAIHSPPARSAVGSWAVARIHSSTGIRATISRLDYNLLTLTFRAGGVTLAADGSRAPFFSAEELRLNLPWAFLRGLAVESFEADNPSLTIVREADGTLNLPRSADPAAASVSGPLDIGRFLVRGLRLRYDDRSAGVLVNASDIVIVLEQSTGGILSGAMPRAAVSVSVDEQQTSLSTLGGRLAFDGRALALENVGLEAPEGRVRVGGKLTMLPGFELAEVQYEGHLDLARVSPWIGIEGVPTGLISFSGTATGPIKTIATTIDANGERLHWPNAGPVSVSTRTSLTRSAAAIESLRVAVAGGELAGGAYVPFDESSTGTAKLRWRNLQLRPLIAAYADATTNVPRVAAVAEGSASLSWRGRALLTARGTVENDLAAAPPSRGDIPVSGSATLTLEEGIWRLSHAHRIGNAAEMTGRSQGRIDSDRPASSTLTGSVELQVSNLSNAIQLANQAGLAGDADTLSKLAGRATITGDLAGTIGAPTATGTIQLADLRYNDTGPGVITGHYSASSGRILFDAIQGTLGANTLSGQSSIDLRTRALGGELNGEWPEVGLFANDIPSEWRPSGSATLAARIGGTIDNPSVAAELVSDGLQIAGQVVQSLRSTLHLANHSVTLDQLTLNQGDGRLEGTGTYALMSGRFSGGVKGNNLTLAASNSTLPVDAKFDLELSGEGTFAAPHTDGFVEFSRLTYEGIDIGRARMELQSAGRELELKGHAPDLNSSVTARVAVGEPRTFTADVLVDGARIDKLFPPEQRPSTVALDGTIGLRLHANGRFDALEDANAQVDVQTIDATVNGVAVNARPARLRYSRDTLVAENLEVGIGATRLVATGRLAPAVPAGEALRISLSGPIADLMPIVRTTNVDALDASGTIDLQMQVTGRPRSPDISADVTVASATLVSSALLPATDVNLRASYAAGVMDLRELGATWQGARITGTGRVPAAILADRLPKWYAATLPPLRDPARATLRVGSITPSVLSSFVPEGALADVTGRIDAFVSVTATSLDVERVEADVTLERAELSFAKVPLNQSRPTRLRLEDGRLQVVDWTWAGAGNRVNVSGGALLTGDSPRVDMALDGTLDLRMLSAFSPDVATTGRAAIDVKITGLAGEPLVDGRMSIENGGLVLRAPRFAVNDLRGDVTFARDSLRLGEITASANGGTLRITGGVEYPKFTLSGGSIAISGRGLALEVPDHLRSEIDADLQLKLSDKAPTVTGSVTVLRGSYREPVSLAAQLLTGVEVEPIVQPAQGRAGIFDRILLNVDVKTAEGVVVDNNYARIDISTNLRIVGTLDEPVPTGRLSIEEGGDVFLGGRTYDVVRGTVDFTNATRVEPIVDLALQTRVQRYDITLEVTGTPETIRANLRSPGVSQNELISLLLTGQRSDATAIAQADIARGQLLMLLSGELLGFAGRAVGLDTVQLSHGLGAAASDFDLLATDTDPSARLTIGKQLSRDVEVVFSQALSETGDITWIAIYRPIQSVEVRGATQDDGSRSYEFRHEFSFGGGGAPPPRSETAGRPTEHVTEITIHGSPGFGDEEVRRQLRLTEGDRFDFYRWQQDRDRLLRFYHEREFLEARVAARRTPVPGGRPGVSLDYEIERGPQTKLTIDGHPLPRDFVERMEEAWVWAVFDGFLLDDLASIAKESLTDAGYLRADVQAMVVSEPDAALKEIAVRIDPGTRFTDRRITFSGQQALSASTLETLIRSTSLGPRTSNSARAGRGQSVEASMWHDPSVLQAAVEQQYRRRGYLEASVKAQPPIFNGQSAELPVQISEGRQYTVARLEVRGAQARSQDQVAATFGVTAGSAFQPATLEPARRSVEVDYLRDGYNNVRVTVTPAIDAARGSVDLLLDVDEGNQQVLAGIDVTGAEITRRGVIDRALDIEIGQPANQAEFFRAETRLYDTGAFRTADIALVPFETDESRRLERVRAEVTLRELPPYRFRYGFRVNDTITPTEIDRELRPAFVVDLLRRNLFGHAISAGVAGQLEADRRLLRGVLTLPRFFGLPVTTNLFATRSREDFTPAGATPFVEDESGITAEQRFTPSPKMAITYGYEYSRSHIFEPDPVPGIPPLELQAKVARLTTTYAWDRRNDPFAPQDGWFHSSGVELGAKALGSDLRFVRYLAQQHYYRSLHRRLVLASAARLGFGRGFEQDLIPSERFYAGGGTSVRGFVEDGLGEADFFGDPRGGNAMLILNQEARMFLFGWVHGVAFVDAGNVFRRASDFSLTNLEAGAGGGIRINSPFALLRIDFGVPLTSRGHQPSGRWYFGIGHAF